MCGGGGGGSDKALNYQITQENERKNRIAQGERQLEELFAPLEGKVRRASGPLGNMNEDQVYARLQEILPPTPTNLFRGPVRALQAAIRGPAPDATQQLTQLGFSPEQAQLRDAGALLRAFRGGAGVQYKDGGTPIWEQHKQSYLDYANPQLERQFGDASDQLTYALSRAGQTGGSVAVDRRENLETDRGQRQLDVAQTAQGYADRARSDISQQKQSLLQMLNSTGNPGATSQAARSALSAISAKPAMSPLGMLFQNTTAGLAGAVPAYREGQQNARVDNIIYGRDPDSGSGRVVR